MSAASSHPPGDVIPAMKIDHGPEPRHAYGIAVRAPDGTWRFSTSKSDLVEGSRLHRLWERHPQTHKKRTKFYLTWFKDAMKQEDWAYLEDLASGHGGVVTREEALQLVAGLPASTLTPLKRSPGPHVHREATRPKTRNSPASTAVASRSNAGPPERQKGTRYVELEVEAGGTEEPPRPMVEMVLAIDSGSTTSVAVMMKPDGSSIQELKLDEFEDGGTQLSSAVYFKTDMTAMIGGAAPYAYGTDLRSGGAVGTMITQWKSYLGYYFPEDQQLPDNPAFVRGDDGYLQVAMPNGERVELDVVVALVFAHILSASFESCPNAKLTSVGIGVPCEYTSQQRFRLKRAIELAARAIGRQEDVGRLLLFDEATAGLVAVLHRDKLQLSGISKFNILDSGGSTVDAKRVTTTIQGNHTALTVLRSSSRPVGGDALTNEIKRVFIAEALGEEKFDRLSAADRMDLHTEAEKSKRLLSGSCSWFRRDEWKLSKKPPTTEQESVKFTMVFQDVVFQSNLRQMRAKCRKALSPITQLISNMQKGLPRGNIMPTRVICMGGNFRGPMPLLAVDGAHSKVPLRQGEVSDIARGSGLLAVVGGVDWEAAGTRHSYAVKEVVANDIGLMLKDSNDELQFDPVFEQSTQRPASRTVEVIFQKGRGPEYEVEVAEKLPPLLTHGNEHLLATLSVFRFVTASGEKVSKSNVTSSHDPPGIVVCLDVSVDENSVVSIVARSTDEHVKLAGVCHPWDRERTEEGVRFLRKVLHLQD